MRPADARDSSRLSEANSHISFRRIWALTWPMLVFNVLEMTVGFADLLMVRPFGTSATAAIGVSRQVTFVVEVAAIAIASGVIAVVSQAVGAQDRRRVDRTILQGVYLVLLCGLTTSLVGLLLCRPLLWAMNTDGDTLAYAASYLQWYFAGLVFSWLSFVATALFRGGGDAITPMKVALATNALNIVFNYVFIYGAGPIPAFEVAGAAIGTVAARNCAAVLYLILLVRGRPFGRLRVGKQAETWRPDRQVIARIVRIGTPVALASILRNASRLVFLSIAGATAAGITLHATIGLGLQVRLIGILPALAFQTATATLVGQAIGRQDLREAESIARRALVSLAFVMLLIAFLLIGLSGWLAPLLIADPEVAERGVTVLRWFAIAQLFSGMSIGAQGVLVGAGDTRPTMRYTFISQWLVMLPLALALSHFGPDPVLGLLIAWTIAPIVAMVLMIGRVLRGKWKPDVSAEQEALYPRDRKPAPSP